MGTYKEEVLVDTPLLYYRLDDTETAEAKDIGSLKLNGAVTGTIPSVTGALTSSGDPDAGSGWSGVAANVITVPANAGTNLTAAFSIEAWVKPLSASGNYGVWSKSVGGVVNTGFSMFLQEGRLFVQTVKGGQKNLDTGVKLTAGVYSYCVATYDGTTLRAFINATEVGIPKAIAGPLEGGEGEAVIGDRIGTAVYPMNGSLDELAIYGAALSQARISVHYTAGSEGPPSPFTESGAMPRAGHKHPAIRVGALA